MKLPSWYQSKLDGDLDRTASLTHQSRGYKSVFKKGQNTVWYIPTSFDTVSCKKVPHTTCYKLTLFFSQSIMSQAITIQSYLQKLQRKLLLDITRQHHYSCTLHITRCTLGISRNHCRHHRGLLMYDKCIFSLSLEQNTLGNITT